MALLGLNEDREGHHRRLLRQNQASALGCDLEDQPRHFNDRRCVHMKHRCDPFRRVR